MDIKKEKVRINPHLFCYFYRKYFLHMELKDRLDILAQAATLAQKGGILSLEEASVAKQAIDLLGSQTDLKTAVNVLIQIASIGQKKGAYTLKDAYYIFLAIDGIENYIESNEETETEKGVN